MTVVPLRMVNVSVPSLTVPAALVMVALSVTFWPAVLKVETRWRQRWWTPPR